MLSLSYSRRGVVCRSNSAKDQNNKAKYEKSKKIFSDFHNKRAETFKKNANDLARVSQTELNELNEFVKELDTFHKAQFEELKEAFSKKEATSEPKVEVVDATVLVNVSASDGDEENIFLKK